MYVFLSQDIKITSFLYAQKATWTQILWRFMQHILCSFLLQVQDAWAAGQGSRPTSAGCRAQADANGWWWESWSSHAKSTQMGTCLMQTHLSYVLNRGSKTQAPLTLQKAQGEFHPPANYKWWVHYSCNLNLTPPLNLFFQYVKDHVLACEEAYVWVNISVVCKQLCIIHR